MEDLVRRLGGPSKTADFFGVSRATVSAWRHRSGRLPPERYFEQQEKLAGAGIAVHPGLWFVELRDRTMTRTANGWRL